MSVSGPDEGDDSRIARRSSRLAIFRVPRRSMAKWANWAKFMPNFTSNSGVVVLFMSDVEGSTKLWEQDSEAMASAMAAHDAIFDRLLPEFNGTILKERGEGDSQFAVFSRPNDAIEAAIAVQRAIGGMEWPTKTPIATRIALHAGDPGLRDADFYGPSVNRCARLRAIGHGGQILISHALEQLARDGLSPSVTLEDLGEHKLRDLSRLERTFQVKHAALGQRFPPLRSVDIRPNNLPVQLTSFVGRDAELHAVRDLMGHRLLTLVGAGGSGKTRLALAAAAETIDEFRDGTWFVDLAPLPARADVETRIADVLCTPSAADSPAERLLFETRGKQLLLVLDNCEHVLEQAAEFCRAFLANSRQSHILATSRQVLNVPGEQSYLVPGMALAGAAERGLASRLLASDSGRLFAERAHEVDPEFQIVRSNAEAISDICRKLDGLPLAIELAASRVRVMTPSQIQERLQDRFRLLAGRQQGPDRHRTLLATVEWSYSLLPESERVLFLRLAVFRGGFSLDMAEDICGGTGVDGPVIDHLQGLVERSMVLMEHRAPNLNRFRMLETLREFAHERLRSSGEEEALIGRLWDWFDRLTAGFAGPTEHQPDAASFDRIEQEFDNLTFAMHATLSRGTDHTPQLELLYRLSLFWIQRGYTSVARTWLETALDSSGAEAQLRVRSMNLLSILAMRESDLDRAGAGFRECVPIWKELGDKTGLAATLSNLGMVERGKGHTSEAAKVLSKSVALFREQGLRRRLGNALINLGWVLSDSDDPESARAPLEEGIEIAQEHEDHSGECHGHANLAKLELLEGHLSNTLDHLQRSFEAGLRARDVAGICSALLTSAETLTTLGRVPEAAEALGSAQRAARDLGGSQSPPERRRLENLEANLRMAFGSDAYEDARSLGLAHSPEQAAHWMANLINTLT